MDCQLPEMNGFQATRRIREGERASGAPRVPIIALTAGATKEDVDRCYACDMDDFVAKPLDAARLLRLIAAHLEGRGRPAPAPRRPIADLGQALARVQGNAALLSRLAAQLREVAPAAVDELARAVESRDVSRTRFLTHRLSSQVATFGAEHVVIELDGLRSAISDGRFADAESRMDELRVTVDRLLGELARRAG
jgi:DNA-binding response OmpR family regulator